MTQPSLVDWEYWHNVWPTRRTLLTRGNAADGFPRPLTPLTQDLVVIFENSGVHDFLEKCLKVRKPGGPRPPFWMAFWGYVAVDADRHADLGDAMPGNSRRATLQRYSNLKPDPDHTEPARRLRDVPRRAAVTMRMIRSGRRAPRRIEAQLATIRGLRRDPARLDERGCRRWIDDLEAVHSEAWETLLIGAGIAGTAFTFTTRLLGWATRGRAGDLANRLHVGIGNNESAEMGHTVRRLAEHARSHAAVGAALGRPVDEVLAADASFAEMFAAALERFGFHTAPELELAQPTWRQEPRQLLDLIAREYARPSETAETAQSTRRQAEADLRAQVPALARLPIRLALRGSRHMMGVRENSKAPAVLIFDELRRVLEVAGPLLAARGVIAEPGDALYLRYAELKAVLGGADGPGRAEIEDRKLQLQRCNQVTLPDLFEAEPGWVGLPSAEAFRSRGMLPPETTSADDSVIRGVAASPGRVTATVRVLSDPFDDFEPGDVLVTRTVDPGWSAALASAGGVVLDIGGPMSHGAMVARELGVPCVVGTKVATTRLVNGMTVTLDGSSGEVHIH